MKEKGDPCILVGYSTQSKGYRVYNKRTRLIVESIHLRFDEIKETSETSVANDTSGLVPQRQKVSPLADTTIPSQQELDLLFGPLYDEFFNDGTSRVNKSFSPTDNSIQKDTLPSTHIQPTSEPKTPTNVESSSPVQENAESSLRKKMLSLPHATIIKQNLPILSVHRYKKMLSLPHATLVLQICIPLISLKIPNTDGQKITY
ncbi:hypothetical protein Tco_0368644 [Tanacetum coccineum]